MNDIEFIFRVAAIEEHDDWIDDGPAHGEKDARSWRSKSTGEVRVQIIKPGTPSTKESTNTSTMPQDDDKRRKPLVTPEEDEAYLKAVKSGNLGLAQKMVGEAAKRAGFSIGPVSHITNSNTDFTEFDFNKSSKSSVWGTGIYASFDKPWKIYGVNDAKVMNGYVGGKNIEIGRPLSFEELRPIFEALNKPQKEYDTLPTLSLEKRYGSVANGLREIGYSSLTHNGPGNTGKHILILDKNMFKSSDPVVKDDSGEVVPLSKRFDINSPDIRGNLKRASLLIFSAIEEEHDDWEDMGPAPGEKKKRVWKSKSTGEKRTQIMKPRTPSVLEKLGDGGVEEMEDNDGYSSHSGMLKTVRELEKEKDKIADKMREFNDKYGSVTNPKKAPKSAQKKHEERSVEFGAIKGKISGIYDRIRGRSRNVTEVKNTAPWVSMPEDFIDSVLSHDPLRDGIGKRHENSSGSNVVYFDFDGGGMGSVFKPSAYEFTIEDDDRYAGGQYKKEAMAYELDSVLDLGIVPPTKIVEKKLTAGSSNHKYGGSSQLMVKGERVYAKDFIDRLHEDDKLRHGLMKAAIFDYISGNMDRHIGNILWNKDNGDVYAIDNGLSFPSDSGDGFFNGKNHTALVFEYIKNIGIDENMVDEIAKRINDNKDKIDDIFKRHGFEQDHKDSFWDRVSKLKDINKMMWAAHPPGTRLVK